MDMVFAPDHALDMQQAAALKARLLGMMLTRQDAAYDDYRRAWNLTVDQHPALIVVAANAADVQEAVRFARDAGMPIAVQATGHGVARAADDALLLVTSHMTSVQIDATAQTARIEAGVKWGAVLEQAQAVGLAPLLGSSSTVGAVGYTLGGGLGWLARQYGLSADSVESFEVVTTEGDLLHVSATNNAELFWGLRGGGGSLAIVTAMTIKLYPVTMVYGGNLFYPIAQAKAVMQRYREWIATAPDALTSAVVVMHFPPLPDLPPFLQGQSFVMVRGCYVGDMADGEALLKFWRDWQAPAFDFFGPMPFSAVATISSDPVDPIPGYASGAWLHDLSDATIDTVLEYLNPAQGASPLLLAEIRHIGGAVSKVDPRSSAYGHRDKSLLLHMAGAAFMPGMVQALEVYVAQFKAALGAGVAGEYINFLDGEAKWKAVDAAYSIETQERLAALKAKYDPANRLSFSLNIQPRK